MVILMEEGVLDSDYGYGERGNAVKILRMQKLSSGEQKVYVKKLWLKDLKVIINGKRIVLDGICCLIFLVLVIILFLLMNPNYKFFLFIYIYLRTEYFATFKNLCDLNFDYLHITKIFCQLFSIVNLKPDNLIYKLYSYIIYFI